MEIFIAGEELSNGIFSRSRDSLKPSEEKLFFGDPAMRG